VYLHVLSNSLFTAHCSTWPYVVGGTENIVKELQLNKDCISHFAAFLYCNSLVGNLQSNSCIRGWSDPHSLAQVTAVVNALGVYSAIRAWKSTTQERGAHDARCESSSDIAAHPCSADRWTTPRATKQALTTSESLHMKLVMLVTGMGFGRCSIRSQYNVRKRRQKQEAMPVGPNHDSLTLTPTGKD
jgi:hypothetical protein